MKISVLDPQQDKYTEQLWVPKVAKALVSLIESDNESASDYVTATIEEVSKCVVSTASGSFMNLARQPRSPIFFSRPFEEHLNKKKARQECMKLCFRFTACQNVLVSKALEKLNKILQDTIKEAYYTTEVPSALTDVKNIRSLRGPSGALKPKKVMIVKKPDFDEKFRKASAIDPNLTELIFAMNKPQSQKTTVASLNLYDLLNEDNWDYSIVELKISDWNDEKRVDDAKVLVSWKHDALEHLHLRQKIVLYKSDDFDQQYQLYQEVCRKMEKDRLGRNEFARDPESFKKQKNLPDSELSDQSHWNPLLVRTEKGPGFENIFLTSFIELPKPESFNLQKIEIWVPHLTPHVVAAVWTFFRQISGSILPSRLFE